MWRRNSPWYSLKFSSTATPTPTTTPLTLLLFPLPLSFSLSSVCSDCHRLALLPPCMPPRIVHDHFWWIHKTCCILDWDGAVEKTRVMERRKAISTSAEEGIEKGGGWSSECVLGWWDAQITRERGERMKVAAIGFAILISVVHRWKEQVSTASEGRISFGREWMQGTLLKELPSLNRDQTFPDLHMPAVNPPCRPEVQHVTPRIRTNRGLQLLTKATKKNKKRCKLIPKCNFPDTTTYLMSPATWHFESNRWPTVVWFDQPATCQWQRSLIQLQKCSLAFLSDLKFDETFL